VLTCLIFKAVGASATGTLYPRSIWWIWTHLRGHPDGRCVQLDGATMLRVDRCSWSRGEVGTVRGISAGWSSLPLKFAQFMFQLPLLVEAVTDLAHHSLVFRPTSVQPLHQVGHLNKKKNPSFLPKWWIFNDHKVTSSNTKTSRTVLLRWPFQNLGNFTFLLRMLMNHFYLISLLFLLDLFSICFTDVPIFLLL